MGNYFENNIKPIFTTLLYFRVPLTVALLSLLIFVFVDQTLEIYRSIALDNNIYKAILSTFFVTILSILVWYSGRLLEFKKTNSENQLWLTILPRLLGTVPLASLTLGIVRALNNFSNLFLILWFILYCITTILVLIFINRHNLFEEGNFLRWFNPNDASGVEDGKQKRPSSKAQDTFINIAYTLFSAICLSTIFIDLGARVVFFLGIILNLIYFVWQKRIVKNVFILYLVVSLVLFFIRLIKIILMEIEIDGNLDSDSNLFLICWLIFCYITTIFAVLLFINRRNIFKTDNALGFLNLDNILGVENDEYGLFSGQFENIFVNVAYIFFSAFCLPIIATNSKSSMGVIAIFVLGLLLNLILFLWHRNQFRDILILYLISLIATLIFLFKLPTVALVSNIGSVSVVAISLSIMAVVFATIYHWGIENKIPALTAIIISLLISSLFNWNDNHQIRQLAIEANRELPTLEISFNQWLASREDFEKYREQQKPYPVYLVSAQGGGIFAAYHASTALSKLQDSLPNFSQHIFAISSVSGGSLGASAFSSLVKENIEDRQPLEPKAIKLFDQDLISPLLSMGLFPDLLQRFLPFSINTWDRAIGLEIAFEKAWEQTYINETEEKELSRDDENPLKKSYYAHWQPQSIAPALVINTTEVETGERLRISPFKIPLPEGAENVFEEENIDFRLSTAAGLSARFPFVTPVGWYEKKDNQTKSRLADGGYFDNSGVSTALDIGRTLGQIKDFGTKFDVIYLSIIDLPNQSSSNKMNNQGLNEIGSPIRALFNVRTARGKTIVQQAQDSLNKEISNPFQYKFRNLYLDKQPDKVRLPLGWLLSEYSQREIDKQNTTAEECIEETFNNESNQSDNELNVANHNACIAKSIAYDLTLN